jgi:hypothetical protein
VVLPDEPDPWVGPIGPELRRGSAKVGRENVQPWPKSYNLYRTTGPRAIAALLHFACIEIEQVGDFAAVARIWNEPPKVSIYRYTSAAASLFSSKNPQGQALMMCDRCFDLAKSSLLRSLLWAGLMLFTPIAPLIAQEFESEQQVKKINELIAQTWSDYSLTSSADATDGEWCRRVYLDLVGRIPSVDELAAFTSDKDKFKKERLVNKLLYDDQYTGEYARNWTTVWTNLLIGRTGGTQDDSLISRPGMQKYLRDSFARNKPYHQLVSELVTATGRVAPGSEEFNGAANFLIDKVNEEQAAQATAATTKLFLGLQVQCTQCHNHPFNDWKQQKYWEMNAFFRQVRAFRGASELESPQLANQDYAGESGNPDEADLFYELRNGQIKVAYPVFVDGTEIPRSGYVNVVNRRSEFSKMMVASPYFAKTIVNRTWSHFLGYGFTKPVDDLGPHNVPSHPELLEYLAQEFQKSGYDLKKLMTWVVLSRPYALSSQRSSNNEKDDPMLGGPPRFSHFYIRQMSAEQLYESLLVSTQTGQAQGSYEEQEERKNRWLQQFSTAFGNDEGGEATIFNGTIPQILMMFNGEMIRAATSGESGTIIDSLVTNTKLKDQQRVEQLYLAGLARLPSREELKTAQELLAARNGDVRQMLRDQWWIILNSGEFIFNF